MSSKFVQDTQLTALAIKFKNPDRVLIADKIFPKSSVGTETFEYTVQSKEALYALPDTRISKTGAWPTHDIGGTKLSATTKDNGIMIPLSNKVIDQAPAGSDPRAMAVEAATSVMQLRRESNAARVAFNPATYPVGNKALLAGANQWSDVTSNPLTAIMAAFDSCLVRPNKLALGMPVWQALQLGLPLPAHGAH